MNNNDSCFYVGISSDGMIIFLAKPLELHHKKKCFNTLLTAASELQNLGVRIRNDIAEADGANMMEAQCCMFLFNAKKCILLFVNASNHEDNISVCVEFEKEFFPKKISPALDSFIENYFLIKIVRKNINPRKQIST